MTTLDQALAASHRLLLEAPLRPLQGHRFQPTGFPDLGAGAYQLPDGTPMLLVESAQSVANRLETAIWDEANDRPIAPLGSMPFVRVRLDGSATTNSILEAHRLNSPYILEGSDTRVFEMLSKGLDTSANAPVDLQKLASILLRVDPNSLLHGVFLAKKELAGGRLRIKRALSGFIEARGVRVAESGGVKNDRVDPSGDTAKGFGNVPYHRTEYVAADIRAYFNLDLALLRSYRLDSPALEFLIALALFKIRRFVSEGLRLRTACDLELQGDVVVTRPDGFHMPVDQDLSDQLARLVEKCTEKRLFASPPVTELTWKPDKVARRKKPAEEDGDDAEDEE
ncbi:MAG: type I-U CRISPR-associated RAMP protein Csb1/Cas7u [Candidatus Thermoplasmatota archaeon]